MIEQTTLKNILTCIIAVIIFIFQSLNYLIAWIKKSINHREKSAIIVTTDTTISSDSKPNDNKTSGSFIGVQESIQNHFDIPLIVAEDDPKVDNLIENSQLLNSSSISNDKYEYDQFMDHFIDDSYVARGLGLITATVGREAEFYLYSKYGNNFENIVIELKGRNGEIGESTISSSISVIPIEPKSIPIEYVYDTDRIKVTYTPFSGGVHTLTLLRNGLPICRSPYYISVEKSPSNSRSRIRLGTKKYRMATKFGKGKQSPIETKDNIVPVIEPGKPTIVKSSVWPISEEQPTGTDVMSIVTKFESKNKAVKNRLQKRMTSITERNNENDDETSMSFGEHPRIEASYINYTTYDNVLNVCKINSRLKSSNTKYSNNVDNLHENNKRVNNTVDDDDEQINQFMTKLDEDFKISNIVLQKENVSPPSHQNNINSVDVLGGSIGDRNSSYVEKHNQISSRNKPLEDRNDKIISSKHETVQSLIKITSNEPGVNEVSYFDAGEKKSSYLIKNTYESESNPNDQTSQQITDPRHHNINTPPATVITKITNSLCEKCLKQVLGILLESPRDIDIKYNENSNKSHSNSETTLAQPIRIDINVDNASENAIRKNTHEHKNPCTQINSSSNLQPLDTIDNNVKYTLPSEIETLENTFEESGVNNNNTELIIEPDVYSGEVNRILDENRTDKITILHTEHYIEADEGELRENIILPENETISQKYTENEEHVCMNSNIINTNTTGGPENKIELQDLYNSQKPVEQDVDSMKLISDCYLNICKKLDGFSEKHTEILDTHDLSIISVNENTNETLDGDESKLIIEQKTNSKDNFNIKNCTINDTASVSIKQILAKDECTELDHEQKIGGICETNDLQSLELIITRNKRQKLLIEQSIEPIVNSFKNHMIERILQLCLNEDFSDKNRTKVVEGYCTLNEINEPYEIKCNNHTKKTKLNVENKKRKNEIHTTQENKEVPENILCEEKLDDNLLKSAENIIEKNLTSAPNNVPTLSETKLEQMINVAIQHSNVQQKSSFNYDTNDEAIIEVQTTSSERSRPNIIHTEIEDVLHENPDIETVTSNNILIMENIENRNELPLATTEIVMVENTDIIIESEITFIPQMLNKSTTITIGKLDAVEVNASSDVQMTDYTENKIDLTNTPKSITDREILKQLSTEKIENTIVNSISDHLENRIKNLNQSNDIITFKEKSSENTRNIITNNFNTLQIENINETIDNANNIENVNIHEDVKTVEILSTGEDKNIKKAKGLIVDIQSTNTDVIVVQTPTVVDLKKEQIFKIMNSEEEKLNETEIKNLSDTDKSCDKGNIITKYTSVDIPLSNITELEMQEISSELETKSQTKILSYIKDMHNTKFDETRMQKTKGNFSIEDTQNKIEMINITYDPISNNITSSVRAITNTEQFKSTREVPNLNQHFINITVVEKSKIIDIKITMTPEISNENNNKILKNEEPRRIEVDTKTDILTSFLSQDESIEINACPDIPENHSSTIKVETKYETPVIEGILTEEKFKTEVENQLENEPLGQNNALINVKINSITPDIIPEYNIQIEPQNLSETLNSKRLQDRPIKNDEVVKKDTPIPPIRPENVLVSSTNEEKTQNKPEKNQEAHETAITDTSNINDIEKATIIIPVPKAVETFSTIESFQPARTAAKDINHIKTENQPDLTNPDTVVIATLRQVGTKTVTDNQKSQDLQILSIQETLKPNKQAIESFTLSDKSEILQEEKKLKIENESLSMTLNTGKFPDLLSEITNKKERIQQSYTASEETQSTSLEEIIKKEPESPTIRELNELESVLIDAENNINTDINNSQNSKYENKIQKSQYKETETTGENVESENQTADLIKIYSSPNITPEDQHLKKEKQHLSEPFNSKESTTELTENKKQAEMKLAPQGTVTTDNTNKFGTETVTQKQELKDEQNAPKEKAVIRSKLTSDIDVEILSDSKLIENKQSLLVKETIHTEMKIDNSNSKEDKTITEDFTKPAIPVKVTSAILNISSKIPVKEPSITIIESVSSSLNLNIKESTDDPVHEQEVEKEKTPPDPKIYAKLVEKNRNEEHTAYISEKAETLKIDNSNANDIEITINITASHDDNTTSAVNSIEPAKILTEEINQNESKEQYVTNNQQNIKILDLDTVIIPTSKQGSLDTVTDNQVLQEEQIVPIQDNLKPEKQSSESLSVSNESEIPPVNQTSEKETEFLLMPLNSKVSLTLLEKMTKQEAEEEIIALSHIISNNIHVEPKEKTTQKETEIYTGNELVEPRTVLIDTPENIDIVSETNIKGRESKAKETVELEKEATESFAVLNESILTPVQETLKIDTDLSAITSNSEESPVIFAENKTEAEINFPCTSITKDDAQLLSAKKTIKNTTDIKSENEVIHSDSLIDQPLKSVNEAMSVTLNSINTPKNINTILEINVQNEKTKTEETVKSEKEASESFSVPSKSLIIPIQKTLKVDIDILEMTSNIEESPARLDDDKTEVGINTACPSITKDNAQSSSAKKSNQNTTDIKSENEAIHPETFVDVPFKCVNNATSITLNSIDTLNTTVEGNLKVKIENLPLFIKTKEVQSLSVKDTPQYQIEPQQETEPVSESDVINTSINLLTEVATDILKPFDDINVSIEECIQPEKQVTDMVPKSGFSDIVIAKMSFKAAIEPVLLPINLEAPPTSSVELTREEEEKMTFTSTSSENIQEILMEKTIKIDDQFEPEIVIEGSTKQIDVETIVDNQILQKYQNTSTEETYLEKSALHKIQLPSVSDIAPIDETLKTEIEPLTFVFNTEKLSVVTVQSTKELEEETTFSYNVSEDKQIIPNINTNQNQTKIQIKNDQVDSVTITINNLSNIHSDQAIESTEKSVERAKTLTEKINQNGSKKDLEIELADSVPVDIDPLIQVDTKMVTENQASQDKQPMTIKESVKLASEKFSDSSRSEITPEHKSLKICKHFISMNLYSKESPDLSAESTTEVTKSDAFEESQLKCVNEPLSITLNSTDNSHVSIDDRLEIELEDSSSFKKTDDSQLLSVEDKTRYQSNSENELVPEFITEDPSTNIHIEVATDISKSVDVISLSMEDCIQLAKQITDMIPIPSASDVTLPEILSSTEIEPESLHLNSDESSTVLLAIKNTDEEKIPLVSTVSEDVGKILIEESIEKENEKSIVNLLKKPETIMIDTSRNTDTKLKINIQNPQHDETIITEIDKYTSKPFPVSTEIEINPIKEYLKIETERESIHFNSGDSSVQNTKTEKENIPPTAIITVSEGTQSLSTEETIQKETEYLTENELVELKTVTVNNLEDIVIEMESNIQKSNNEVSVPEKNLENKKSPISRTPNLTPAENIIKPKKKSELLVTYHAESPAVLDKGKTQLKVDSLSIATPSENEHTFLAKERIQNEAKHISENKLIDEGILINDVELKTVNSSESINKIIFLMDETFDQENKSSYNNFNSANRDLVKETLKAKNEPVSLTYHSEISTDVSIQNEKKSDEKTSLTCTENKDKEIILVEEVFEREINEPSSNIQVQPKAIFIDTTQIVDKEIIAIDQKLNDGETILIEETLATEKHISDTISICNSPDTASIYYEDVMKTKSDALHLNSVKSSFPSIGITKDKKVKIPSRVKNKNEQKLSNKETFQNETKLQPENNNLISSLPNIVNNLTNIVTDNSKSENKNIEITKNIQILKDEQSIFMEESLESNNLVSETIPMSSTSDIFGIDEILKKEEEPVCMTSNSKEFHDISIAKTNKRNEATKETDIVFKDIQVLLAKHAIQNKLENEINYHTTLELERTSSGKTNQFKTKNQPNIKMLDPTTVVIATSNRVNIETVTDNRASQDNQTLSTSTPEKQVSEMNIEFMSNPLLTENTQSLLVDETIRTETVNTNSEDDKTKTVGFIHLPTQVLSIPSVSNIVLVTGPSIANTETVSLILNSKDPADDTILKPEMEEEKSPSLPLVSEDVQAELVVDKNHKKGHTNNIQVEAEILKVNSSNVYDTEITINSIASQDDKTTSMVNLVKSANTLAEEINHSENEKHKHSEMIYKQNIKILDPETVVIATSKQENQETVTDNQISQEEKPISIQETMKPKKQATESFSISNESEISPMEQTSEKETELLSIPLYSEEEEIIVLSHIVFNDADLKMKIIQEETEMYTENELIEHKPVLIDPQKNIDTVLETNIKNEETKIEKTVKSEKNTSESFAVPSESVITPIQETLKIDTALLEMTSNSEESPAISDEDITEVKINIPCTSITIDDPQSLYVKKATQYTTDVKTENKMIDLETRIDVPLKCVNGRMSVTLDSIDILDESVEGSLKVEVRDSSPLVKIGNVQSLSAEDTTQYQIEPQSANEPVSESILINTSNKVFTEAATDITKSSDVITLSTKECIQPEKQVIDIIPTLSSSDKAIVEIPFKEATEPIYLPLTLKIPSAASVEITQNKVEKIPLTSTTSEDIPRILIEKTMITDELVEPEIVIEGTTKQVSIETATDVQVTQEYQNTSTEETGNLENPMVDRIQHSSVSEIAPIDKSLKTEIEPISLKLNCEKSLIVAVQSTKEKEEETALSPIVFENVHIVSNKKKNQTVIQLENEEVGSETVITNTSTNIHSDKAIEPFKETNQHNISVETESFKLNSSKTNRAEISSDIPAPYDNTTTSINKSSTSSSKELLSVTVKRKTEVEEKIPSSPVMSDDAQILFVKETIENKTLPRLEHEPVDPETVVVNLSIDESVKLVKQVTDIIPISETAPLTFNFKEPPSELLESTKKLEEKIIENETSVQVIELDLPKKLVADISKSIDTQVLHDEQTGVVKETPDSEKQVSDTNSNFNDYGGVTFEESSKIETKSLLVLEDVPTMQSTEKYNKEMQAFPSAQIIKSSDYLIKKPAHAEIKNLCAIHDINDVSNNDVKFIDQEAISENLMNNTISVDTQGSNKAETEIVTDIPLMNVEETMLVQKLDNIEIKSTAVSILSEKQLKVGEKSETDLSISENIMPRLCQDHTRAISENKQNGLEIDTDLIPSEALVSDNTPILPTVIPKKIEIETLSPTLKNYITEIPVDIESMDSQKSLDTDKFVEEKSNSNSLFECGESSKKIFSDVENNLQEKSYGIQKLEMSVQRMKTCDGDYFEKAFVQLEQTEKIPMGKITVEDENNTAINDKLYTVNESDLNAILCASSLQEALTLLDTKIKSKFKHNNRKSSRKFNSAVHEPNVQTPTSSSSNKNEHFTEARKFFKEMEKNSKK